MMTKCSPLRASLMQRVAPMALGSALLGRKVGDRITYQAPGGSFTYEVVGCEPFRP